MPFVEFDKRAASASKAPFVTLQRKGPLSLNQAAYELVGRPEAVTLLYDEDEKLIGVKPASISQPRALPVRAQGEDANTYVIAGQAFCKHFGIDTSTARRYAVEMRDDLLVVDLKSDSTDVTGPRARSREREPV